jgi:two-component system phosphate regulon response regulator PhoB
MSGEKILVLDEETQRRGMNAFGLRCAGFSVLEACDAPCAFTQISKRCPHLLLIIAALLDFWILDFVRTLRADEFTRDLPVLALVEHEEQADAAAALECGITDLVREPVSPEDFVARVRASLGNAAVTAATGVAGLMLDSQAGQIQCGQQSASVGPTEQRLLEFFLAHPGQLIPRDLLLFRIWGGAVGMRSRVLDVSVCRLRRALETVGCGGLLHTVSRQGYRFAVDA